MDILRAFLLTQLQSFLLYVPVLNLSRRRISLRLPSVDQTGSKMESNFQQKAFVLREEVKGSGLVSIHDQKDTIICPKPLRAGNFMKLQNLRMRQAAEESESLAGAELLDIILRKEEFGIKEVLDQTALWTPLYSGSPPSRSSNPLVQDARFGVEKQSSLSPLHFLPFPSSGGIPSPSSGSRSKAGCNRMKFGLQPAKVRAVGFNCLNRDRQNSSVPTMA